MSHALATSVNSHQFCTFHLAGFHFGVPVLQVQEVLRAQPITHVPLAPPTVRGLINLRGQIVTQIDLGRRLQLPPTPGSDATLLVVYTAEGAVCLVVDAIGDVIEVDDSNREAAPSTVPDGLREAITGVFRLEDRLLIILNIEVITRVSEGTATARC